MSDAAPKGLRDITSGVIGAVATLATAAAGVLGVLHETGYLQGAPTPSPAAIAMPSNMQPSNAPIAATNAELYLSEVGSKLVGTIRRPDGEHPTAWHRVGATCG